MESHEIVQQARDAGVKLVMFAYCDNSGIIRGKATHVSGLERRLTSGIGVTTAMQVMGDMDQLQPIDGMGPVGEFRMMPDLDTFTLLPYAPKRALVLVDMITMDQKPWAACPRNFLKRMLAQAESMGITFQAAFEPEWYLARRDGDTFVPMDESLDNSTLGAAIAREVVDDVVDALEAQGLQSSSTTPRSATASRNSASPTPTPSAPPTTTSSTAKRCATWRGSTAGWRPSRPNLSRIRPETATIPTSARGTPLASVTYSTTPTTRCSSAKWRTISSPVSWNICRALPCSPAPA